MKNIKGRIFNAYCWLAELSFYLFLFGTLSFGRSFSALHVNTPFSTLFVTEVLLLLHIPVLLFKYKSLARLPSVFLSFLSAFFIFGCYLLVEGLYKRNAFALRDITLCGYVLFLPITFIYLNNLNKIKFFTAVCILSNMFNLFLGWGLFLRAYPLGVFYNLVSETKLFNLCLYYAIAISFTISFYGYIKSKVCRLFALIVLSLNVIIIVSSSMSSIWAATLLLFVFLFIILRVKFLKLFCSFTLISIFISSITFCFKPSILTSIFNEARGFNLIFQGMPRQGESMKTLAEVKAVSASTPRQGESVNESPESHVTFGNIAWRFGIWKQTLKFASDSPLIGKGFGGYPVYEIWGTRQYPHGIYLDSGIVPAHNHIITVFFKMGILGLGLFLFMNIYVFIYALSYMNKCNLKFLHNLLIALLGAFVFWHTLALFFDVIDSPPTSIFLWIIIGSIFAAIGIDKNSFCEIREKEVKVNVKKQH